MTKEPKQLVNKTQKVAFILLKQEEKNAIRGRLESLLQQQFLRKYGSKNPNSSLNNAVKAKIHEFVWSYDDIREAEAAIGTLEKQIKEVAANIKASIVAEKAAYRAASKEMKRVPSLGGMPTKENEDDNIEPNRWPVVNAIMMVEAEQKRIKEEEQARIKQQKYVNELSKQIDMNNQQKQKEKVQREKDYQTIQQTMSSFELEQQRLRQEKEERHRQEREMRENQIAENKRLKEHERQMRIAQEQGEMARARRKVEEDEEERRILKQRQKQAQDDLKLENERNKAIKADLLLERQNYEKKLNADYE